MAALSAYFLLTSGDLCVYGYAIRRRWGRRGHRILTFMGWEVTVSDYELAPVQSRRRMRARSVAVGMAVTAALLVVAGVAPPAQAAAPATTVVSLTFDDSNADQMTALTAMQASGLHGTFYAISGSIDTPNYLTVANLQTLYNAGNEIGGHTVNHPDLTLETADEVQRQVYLS